MNKPREDEYGLLPLWQKGALVAACLLLTWWLGSFVAGWFFRGGNHGPLSAEAICKDFQTNPDEARKKYAGNNFEVAGKVKVVDTPRGKLLVFATAEGEWSIHCLFANKKVTDRIIATIAKRPDDQDVVVEGQCQLDPRKGKGVIVLDDCVVRKGI